MWNVFYTYWASQCGLAHFSPEWSRSSYSNGRREEESEALQKVHRLSNYNLTPELEKKCSKVVVLALCLLALSSLPTFPYSPLHYMRLEVYKQHLLGFLGLLVSP